MFQHDNAPAHTARLTQQWLDDNDVQCMMWPAQSPDLNIIENLWDHIGKQILKDRPADKPALIQCLMRTRNSLTLQTIQQLYHSLPRRVHAMTRARGYPTKY